MSTLPDFTGPGFFAGEAPDGLTTIAGTPTSAQVRVYWRDSADPDSPDVLVDSTQSAADGTWQIAGLNPALRYVVRAQKSQFDDVTVVGAAPSRSDVIAYVDHLEPTEEFDGLTGYVLLDSGLPPFTCQVIEPLPYGLTARVDGRKLLIEGASTDEGLWDSVVRVTASNGVWVDVPVQVQIQIQELSDPHFDKVALLLHFDEDFSDVKGGAFQAAGIVTFQPGKFDHGMFLTSGESGVVETAPRGELDLPADFTIEGWMMPTAGTSGAFIGRFQTQSGGNGWQIYLESTGRLSFYHYVYEYYGGAYPIRGVGPDVRDGVWHHVAVTREAGLLRMFVDGVLVGTGSSSVSYTSTITLLSVGYQAQGGGRYPFRGGIDEVRITNGVARYTENFTPPDKPFPNR